MQIYGNDERNAFVQHNCHCSCIVITALVFILITPLLVHFHILLFLDKGLVPLPPSFLSLSVSIPSSLLPSVLGVPSLFTHSLLPPPLPLSPTLPLPAVRACTNCIQHACICTSTAHYPHLPAMPHPPTQPYPSCPQIPLVMLMQDQTKSLFISYRLTVYRAKERHKSNNF